ncbi:MAG: hypothetical protein WD826_01220, partial [Actinomycetota bacterium]
MEAPLAHLLDRAERDPTFREVLYGRADGVALPDAGRPYFLATLAMVLDRCVLAVVPTEADADALRVAVSEFITPTALLSSWDVLPYEGLSPDPRVSAHRLEALRLLAHGNGPRVVVASSRALVHKPAPGAADLEPLHIRAGGAIDRDELAKRLAELGYLREDVAAEPGTFAIRGGVVDIFPAQDDRVVRIELFGDDIESMRFVDPATQRSVGDPLGGDATGVVAVARTELPPTAEIRRRAAGAAELTRDRAYLDDITDKLERLASGATPEGAESLLPRLWDPTTDSIGHILQERCVVVVFDPRRSADEAAKTVEQEEELASLWADPAHLTEELTERPTHVRDEESVLHLPLDVVLDDIREGGTPVWGVHPYASDASTKVLDVHGWDTTTPRALLERCRTMRAEGYDLVFCALEREVGAVGTRLVEEGLDTS